MVWHLMLCLGGRREGIVGRLGILAAVALGRVRAALGCVEIGVFLGAGDVAKRARLADVLRQRRRRLMKMQVALSKNPKKSRAPARAGKYNKRV